MALTIDTTAASVCSITGNTVSLIGVGTCVIDANQAGNPVYNAAPQALLSTTDSTVTPTLSDVTVNYTTIQ